MAAASAPSTALRERLVPPFAGSPVWGWLGPIAVMLVGAYLRLDRLRIPADKIFDEVYYRHDAWSLLHHGTELGDVNKLTYIGAEYVVHPPVAKWMIAAGEAIFGFNSYGWRISAAVVGTVSILVVARTARRMTRSTLLGCVAGLVMCLDGLEFVQSRTGMLDIFLMFWVAVGFACLTLDRDQTRARLANSAVLYPDAAPRAGMRWWLLASGVSVGLAVASKWDGLYFLPAFAAMAFVWTVGARRALGVHRPLVSALRHDAAPIAVLAVVIPALVYVVSWTGWFVTRDGWDRSWANRRPPAWSWIPAVLRSWWHYQWQIWGTDKSLDAYHPYRSNAWGWLFQTRPVLFYANYPHKGQLSCTAGRSGCARMIYDLGNPAIWWAAIPVMMFMAYLVFRRDWRASAILIPFAFGYLPWLFIFHRTMFLFYVLTVLPFVAIGIALTVGYLLGEGDAPPVRRAAGATISGAYLLVVVVLFFYFLPILSAKTISFTDWQHHMWFHSWAESAGS